MFKHKDQRIGVFVDVQNLYYSARNIYNAKVNFKAILNTAIADRKLIRAVAYVIRSQHTEEQTFFDALEKFGFEIKEKDLKVFFGGAKKGDWDVGIAMDMIRSKNLDVLVLVSGDGDFQPLVEYLKNNGQLVEVLAFGKSTAKELKEAADDFIDLDEDNKKYLLGASGPMRAPRQNAQARNRSTRAPRSQQSSQSASAKPATPVLPASSDHSDQTSSSIIPGESTQFNL